MAPRLSWLLLAALLASPAVSAGWNLAAASAFLAEFLSAGRWRPLSTAIQAPRLRTLSASHRGRPIPVDLYTRASLTRPTGLVLVHGLSPTGKDEPRLREAAELLARAGWAVAVPTVDGLTRLRLRPDDAGSVAAATQALARERYSPIAILGISVGATPALLAAADPAVAGSVSAVLALGGYASATELLRYTLTGAYAFGSIRGRRTPDEAAIDHFARANSELVDTGGRQLVENRDADSVERLVATLPPPTRRILDELSPISWISRVRAPLFLVHGRGDPAVPFTESLRLEQAAVEAGHRVRVAIVGAVGHVEPEERASTGDLWRLWALFLGFWHASATRPA